MMFIKRCLTVLLLASAIFMFKGTARAETINYRLKWHFNASVVGDLYALEQGMFREMGLDVNVKAGGVGLNAIRELELGDAMFGVASADQVILAREKGSPVVVIAQLFRVNPLQWIYRSKDLSINAIADLKGKTLGVTFGGNDESIMMTLLSRGNLKVSDVRLFSVRRDFTPFYMKRVDIWPVYRNTQGILIGDKLLARGEAVDFLIPGKFGVQFVANSVVTSEKILKNHPDMVKKFLTALLRGWEEALDPKNEDKAVDILHRHQKETPKTILKRQVGATRKLVKPYPNHTIGGIDEKGWKQTEEIMLKMKVIEKPVFVEKILKTISL